jgi:hypothetical protein
MALVFLVLLIMALPFFAARGLAWIPMPWPIRLLLIAAVTALLLAWLATTPSDITTMGANIAIFFMVVGWLLGSAWSGLGRLIRFAATDTRGDVIAKHDRDRLQRLR